MKKIFTFILLAISTLAMAQAFPSNPGHVAAATPNPYTYDTITIDNLLGAGATADDITKSFSGRTGLSGTKYAGNVAKLDGYDCMLFDDDKSAQIKNTATVGKIHSIKIVWNEDPELNDGAYMRIYAANSAYSSIPTGATTGSCDKNNPEFVFNQQYGYFLMAATNYPVIDQIIIAWEVSQEHNIICATVENGTIVTNKNTAKEGESYTITITPNNGYELINYTINGTKTNVTATSQSMVVTKTMPNRDVNISATFQEAKQRKTAKITLNGGANYYLTSGDTTSFTWTLKYKKNAAQMANITDYDGTIQISSSNSAIVATTNLTNSGVTLIAKARGQTTLTITSPQTDKYTAATVTVTVDVTPKQIYLVAEYNGKHYAMTTTARNGGMEAVEVPYTNGMILNPTDAMKWYISNDGAGYIVQNSANRYLDHSGDNLLLATGKPVLPWILQDGTLSYDGTRFFCYNNAAGIFKAYSDRVVGTTGYSDAAIETQGINASLATLPRNLVKDQFNTVCLPYAFVCPNADVHFYSVACMELKNGKYNFSFDEEDFTSQPSEAGVPYIVRAEDGDHNKDLQILNVEGEAALSAKNGLIGVNQSTYIYDLDRYKTDGLLNVLVFYKGTLVFTETGKVAANSAYLQFLDIPSCDAVSSSPRRVVLEVEKQDAPEVATGVENLSANQINWNEPVYNIMGQRVARGTTGVLIQNGQKFIAE